jgi:hypothetical protein
MMGNCHVRFLEGRASAMGSGYSILCLALLRFSFHQILLKHMKPRACTSNSGCSIKHRPV